MTTSIDKKQRFDIVRDMRNLLLKRRIVLILQRYIDSKKKYPTREEFESYLCRRFWPCFNYILLGENYATPIKESLGDCIAPPPSKSDYREKRRIEYFIDDTGDRNTYKVTDYGRKLTEPFPWIGFIDVFAHKYSDFMKFFLGFIGSGIIWYIVQLVQKFF